MEGEKIFNLMNELWPICRSITGDGVRKTLNIIKNIINDLKIIGKFQRNGMLMMHM